MMMMMVDDGDDNDDKLKNTGHFGYHEFKMKKQETHKYQFV